VPAVAWVGRLVWRWGGAGYRLILTGRNKIELEKTRSLIKKAIAIPADLSNLLTINRFISSVNKLTKRVDVLINLAGIWHSQNEVYAGKDLEKFNQKVILDTFMVGTVAPTLLVHGLLPLMPAGSKIINISGTFESGAKGWLPYYVSKRAIEDLTIALAQELERKIFKSMPFLHRIAPQTLIKNISLNILKMPSPRKQSPNLLLIFVRKTLLGKCLS